MHHPTTDTAIRAAILRELTDEHQRWSAVRRRIPGDDETLTAVLMTMHEECAVTAMKIGGTPYVRLASNLDRTGAARERDLLRQLGWPRSRCRDFVSV